MRERSIISFATQTVVAESELSVPAVFVLVMWLACLGAGLAGFLLPYPRPQAKPIEEPVLAHKIEVELSPEDVKPETAPPVTLPANPAAPEAVTQPQLPRIVTLAQPSPAIAFPMPVATPPIKAAIHATEIRPTTANISARPASAPIEQLTYGVGEGKQPAPEYPRQATRAGQEGIVTVRMVVADDGRVISAEAARPSPWPLLNESALEAVRSRWRFRSGPTRVYEVGIRFKLRK
jgi:periplasmic protein TonB